VGHYSNECDEEETDKRSNKKGTNLINALDDLPEGMLEEHGNITLVTDIMYINKIPFIVMTSRAIHFGTIEMIKDEKRQPLSSHYRS